MATLFEGAAVVRDPRLPSPGTWWEGCTWLSESEQTAAIRKMVETAVDVTGSTHSTRGQVAAPLLASKGWGRKTRPCKDFSPKGYFCCSCYD